MMISLTERAPAKINLTLEIIKRRFDGWHELKSLVAFAGISDHVDFTPDRPLGLTISGNSLALDQNIDDNLILKAARVLQRHIPSLALGHFHLIKRLPVAAGIGGGSSDAAAALRLLARFNAISLDDERIINAAREVGSDVPVCLYPHMQWMEGVGEKLTRLDTKQTFFAVLLNPGIALETERVFQELGLSRVEAFKSSLSSNLSSEDLIHHARNDLQEPAICLVPEIAMALSSMKAMKGCFSSRMSGSGATIFGLFKTCHFAAHAAKQLKKTHPDWWVKATVLR
jgi:4-diphosphocytidyl-2-C-methyl-D-erythritol kinase